VQLNTLTKEAIKMDSQAVDLNNTIQEENPAVYELLSNRGKNIFFPKLGILSQSAQAKDKEINATIGIAKEDNGSPMYLNSLKSQSELPAGSLFPYAPSPGLPDIRKIWKQTQIEKNPSLKNKPFSNPVVTNALTHSLGMAGYLFLEEGDKVIVPDYYWENYDLTFSIAYGSEIQTFPTFDDQRKFNVKGLEAELNQGTGKKIIALNFPNNPTGYTPTLSEIQGIKESLLKAAESGQKLVVLIDDAYFGLVFEEGIYQESIFSELCDLHQNLLAVKIDGPTKEDYVWGFRVGFLSFGIKGGTEALYTALESKAGGAIRGTISNANIIAQSMLVNAWSSDSYQSEKAEKFATLKNRYLTIKKILQNHPEYNEVFEPLPFNSGYFMCIKLIQGDAERVRQKLLNEFSTGVIAFGSLIRLAFSSTPTDQLEKLFDNVYQAAKA